MANNDVLFEDLSAWETYAKELEGDLDTLTTQTFPPRHQKTKYLASRSQDPRTMTTWRHQVNDPVTQNQQLKGQPLW